MSLHSLSLSLLQLNLPGHLSNSSLSSISHETLCVCLHERTIIYFPYFEKVNMTNMSVTVRDSFDCPRLPWSSSSFNESWDYLECSLWFIPLTKSVWSEKYLNDPLSLIFFLNLQLFLFSCTIMKWEHHENIGYIIGCKPKIFIFFRDFEPADTVHSFSIFPLLSLLKFNIFISIVRNKDSFLNSALHSAVLSSFLPCLQTVLSISIPFSDSLLSLWIKGRISFGQRSIRVNNNILRFESLFRRLSSV